MRVAQRPVNTFHRLPACKLTPPRSVSLRAGKRSAGSIRYRNGSRFTSLQESTLDIVADLRQGPVARRRHVDLRSRGRHLHFHGLRHFLGKQAEIGRVKLMLMFRILPVADAVGSNTGYTYQYFFIFAFPVHGDQIAPWLR